MERSKMIIIKSRLGETLSNFTDRLWDISMSNKGILIVGIFNNTTITIVYEGD